MKSLVCGSFLWLLVAAIPATAAAADPVVPVTGGKIHGRLLPAPGGAAFKGVPFAAPPLGELRWREPAPVMPWTGVRDAGAFGASCVQEIPAWNRQEAIGNKEDCLYLNVWTPEWPSKSKKPVMFWIHGGGQYRRRRLGGLLRWRIAEQQGRGARHRQLPAGAVRFLCAPGLTAESAHHASGNYGLLDLLAALKWVRQNIAQFGGDPDNVTVFGQSAGGGNTSMLLASPLAKGLFRRAIQESSGGGVRDMPTQHDVEQAGEKFAASLQAPAGKDGIRSCAACRPRSCRRRPSPRAAPTGRTWVRRSMGGSCVGPAQTFAQGKAHAVPLLIGSNAQEQGGPKPDELRKAVADMYGINAGKAWPTTD